MEIYRILLICICCIGVDRSYAQVYKWVDDKGRIQFSDRPQKGKEEFVTSNKYAKTPQKKAVNQSIKYVPSNIAQNSNAYPKLLTLEIRNLLLKRKYSELNKILHRAQTSSEQNILSEGTLFTAYKSFRIHDESYERIFNKWIEIFPNSYQPYLARANYYHKMGWSSRGGKWASETENKKIDLMKIYFSKSLKDIAKVVELYHKTMLSYGLLIDILVAQGSRSEVDKVAIKALEINPTSYVVRSTYLKSLRPRWGGSYKQMEAVANASLEYINENPKFKFLEGLILKDAGDVARSRGNYNVADAIYTKALDFGENHEVLMARGKNRIKKKDYTNAIKDLSRAIMLHAEDSDYYYYRSKSYRFSKQFDLALSDIKTAEQLSPNDKNIPEQKKYLSNDLERLGNELYEVEKYKESINKHNLSISLIRNDGSKYYNRALSLIKLGDLDTAQKDLKQAIMLNPKNFNYVRALDYNVLSTREEWEQIVVYWNNFIEFVPSSSRAHVEIGGTYYRKRDYETSLKHYKKAADMGSIQGKKYYEDLKFRLVMAKQKKSIKK